jgi:hypothetical protein
MPDKIQLHNLATARRVHDCTYIVARIAVSSPSAFGGRKVGFLRMLEEYAYSTARA